MLTLTLNASEKRVQFLLTQGETLLCAQDWLANKGGTELLAPALARACRDMGHSPADIVRLACVAGPGGFTGIRLVLATASALARANRARQAGLEYLRCLAASVPARPGRTLAVLVNARRGWYYEGLYVVDEDGLPRAQYPARLLELPSGHARTSAGDPENFPSEADYALGSALSAHRELFAPLFSEQTQLLSPAWDHPSPAGLAALTRAIRWEEAGREDIAPIYLRECDAVENLADIAARQGLDPARALDNLQRLTNAPLQDGQTVWI